MRAEIHARLLARLDSIADLIPLIDEDTLEKTIDVPKHKSIKAHLWCLIGARESYAKALAAGDWQGFGCSMKAFGPTDFARHLEASAREIKDVTASVEWTESRERLLAELAEHEVMHEGQLIRHLYAIGLAPPSSWKWA